MVIYVMVAHCSCNSSGCCLSCNYTVVIADMMVVAVLLLQLQLFHLWSLLHVDMAIYIAVAVVACSSCGGCCCGHLSQLWGLLSQLSQWRWLMLWVVVAVAVIVAWQLMLESLLQLRWSPLCSCNRYCLLPQ